MTSAIYFICLVLVLLVLTWVRQLDEQKSNGVYVSSLFACFVANMRIVAAGRPRSGMSLEEMQG